MPVGQEEKVAELRRLGIHQLDGEQIRIVRDFMLRRHTLSADARLRLADQLAAAICDRLQMPVERGERFLQCVLAARTQAEHKETGGGPPA